MNHFKIEITSGFGLAEIVCHETADPELFHRGEVQAIKCSTVEVLRIPMLPKSCFPNWRSHERILDFVNALFSAIMPGAYDENAKLQFADRADRLTEFGTGLNWNGSSLRRAKSWAS